MKKAALKVSLLFFAFTLVGCKSEIDKCTDAQVAAWKEAQKRLAIEIEENKSKPKTVADLMGLTKTELDKRSLAEVEADERFRCLRASVVK